MTTSSAHPSRICSKCKCALTLDDFAIDTQTCYNKHVFFFTCPQCSDYSATAMANIPRPEWPEFIPADRLNEIEAKYDAATNKFG
ncbi:MAG: hypothetical protein OEY43_09245 [Gammaproteobacteria bacterium]|nr:hypothetical protein [Gammaproteobacteria bacterium]